jgi:hypothetical protein
MQVKKSKFVSVEDTKLFTNIVAQEIINKPLHQIDRQLNLVANQNNFNFEACSFAVVVGDEKSASQTINMLVKSVVLN